MKHNKPKSCALRQDPQTDSQPEHHNLLEYYKSKVDALYNERLTWLSKFDECRSKLADKHSLK